MGLGRVILSLAPALLAFLLATQSRAQEPNPPKEPQRGGTAIITYPQDPTTVNPLISTSVPDQTIGCMIYQGLIDVGLDYRPKPVLAKSWSISPDGKTYTFDLIKVNWQDGKPLTSDDVKFTLLEISSKYATTFRPAAERIQSIDTPTPDRVVINLKESFGPMMISLACDRGGAIMPAHIYRGTDARANPATAEKPVGTGPFKLAERKHGDYLRLVKNKDYWEPGKPYLDEIVVKIITQATSRVQALQAEEVDLVPGFPYSSKAAILANPKLKIVESDTTSSNILFFNTARKPLDNKKVRQALYMAIDRNYILKNAFFDVGKVSKNPMTTEIGWINNPKVDLDAMYPFDPAKANALLDEAGVKRGADGKRFPLKIVEFANEYPELIQVAQILKTMWGAVGVDVTIELRENATIIKQIFTDRDFDVHMNAYGTYSDPALGIARSYVTTLGNMVNGNPSGYSNPEVDELFLKGERATAIEDRAPHYQKVQEIIAEDVPAITLRQYTTLNAFAARLWSVHRHAQGNGRWGGAWLDK